MHRERPRKPAGDGNGEATPLTGHSRSIARIQDQIRHVAPTRATVLIEGEAGTGKERVARAIHRESPRKDRPFLSVPLAVLAPDAMETELFGHDKGGWAGARDTRHGAFEKAEGGTLLLEQIGEATPEIQVKLLRVLQDREFDRAGGHETLRADVRLLVASEGDLEAEAKAGRFREDLCNRLCGVRIAMPPLRERREDIPLLVDQFVRELDREHGRKAQGVTAGVLDRFMKYPWPGNIRELRNVVEGMVLCAQGKRPLDLSDLPAALRGSEGESEILHVSVGMTVEEAERELVAATLRHTGYDKPRAAAMLGIGLRTLYRKIKQYGLA
jgi:DNA-binding NtrC family response regulator